MLVGFGIIMLSIGVLGEYLWRTFDAARNRPPYIIEKVEKGEKTDNGKILEICKKHKKILMTIFLIGLFCYYLIWTVSQPYNSCPGEKRNGIFANILQNIIQYLTEENESIRDSIWGISYAFQPILTYIICAVFVKIAFTFYYKSLCISSGCKTCKYNKYDIDNILCNKDFE